MNSRRGFTIAALAAAAFATAQAQAHDPHAHHRAAQPGAAAVAPQSAKVGLSDATVIDQDGRSLRFRSDAIGERIAVVGFAYTTCTTVCPVTSQIMVQARGRLGARTDVGFVTVTVDPVRDKPAVLKAYAQKVGAGPGWLWIGGAKPQVDEVLKGFGAWTPNYVDHPPLVMVGDPKSGRWLRFFGFPNPEQIVAAVSELTAARSAAAKNGTPG